MIAIRLRTPGLDGLAVDELEPPVPAAGETLVQVRAAALTRDELEWPVDRLPAIPSYELSGIDESGNEVFALTDFSRDGVAREYATVAANLLAPKPHSLSHVEAAALPMPALTAWQALFVHGGLERGQRVLITGQSGGVGHVAVQLAKWGGAELVDTDADVVFDTAGGEALEQAKQQLREGGKAVSVAHESEGVIYFVVESSAEQLTEIARLADQGLLRPQIDSVFPLTDARAAFERLAERGKKGKVVLEVSG
jgi:NADPH:quinone reductase-like Zn-dependent oxidoreductase